jgi:hypothetical protein
LLIKNRGFGTIDRLYIAKYKNKERG